MNQFKSNNFSAPIKIHELRVAMHKDNNWTVHHLRRTIYVLVISGLWLMLFHGSKQEDGSAKMNHPLTSYSLKSSI